MDARGALMCGVDARGAEGRKASADDNTASRASIAFSLLERDFRLLRMAIKKKQGGARYC